MFCADINSLWNNVVVNAALYEDTNCTWCDIPNEACCAVVNAVWHAIVDSTINFNINNIAKAECSQRERWCGRAVLPELASEDISCCVTKTIVVTHLPKRKTIPKVAGPEFNEFYFIQLEKKIA